MLNNVVGRIFLGLLGGFIINYLFMMPICSMINSGYGKEIISNKIMYFLIFIIPIIHQITYRLGIKNNFYSIFDFYQDGFLKLKNGSFYYDKYIKYLKKNNLKELQDFHNGKNFEGKICKYLKLNINFNRNYNDDLSIIRYAFVYNNLDIVKWLCTVEKDAIINNKDAIYWACTRGNLDVVKWLFNFENCKTDEQLHPENFDFCPFITACISQNLELVKWLYSTGKFDLNMYNSYPFEVSCKLLNLELSQWLYENMDHFDNEILNQGYKHTVNSIYFHKNYKNYMLFINWLCILGQLNFRIHNDYVFKKLCKYYNDNNYEELKVVIEWFVVNCPSYSVKFYYKSVSYDIKNYFNLIQEYINGNENIELELKKREKTEDCMVCFDTNKFFILLECKHDYCINCFNQLYNTGKLDCYYCFRSIDIEKIKLLN